MLQQRIIENPCVHGDLCIVVVPAAIPESSKTDSSYSSSSLIQNVALPILKLFNYRIEVVPAPEFRPPSYVHHLDDLLSSRLVVADLTGADPNICFEVGIRYLSGRPLLCFIKDGEQPPEALAHLRPISFAADNIHPSIKEFADRLKRIASDDATEGRPIFEVQCHGKGSVMIGDFRLDRQSLRELEARVVERGRDCGCGSSNRSRSVSPHPSRRERH